jgi:two-component system chemotaxis sensor kinase CheA
LPARFVEKVAQVAAADILTVSGRLHWSSPDGPIPVYGLAELLGLADGIPPEGRFHAVVVNRESGRELLTVDRLVGLRQVVLRELPPAAAAAGLYSGCIPLEDGTSGLLLDMPAVLARAAAAPGLRARIEAGPIAAPQIHLPAILVVDDSYTSRTLEAGVIESMGYRVFQAADGLDGLRVLRNEAVDIILCDVEMPRMDGFGMLAAVKSNDRLRDIPFILISSIEDPSIVEKGLALGADSYIVKRHFEQDALRDIIAHYL